MDILNDKKVVIMTLKLWGYAYVWWENIRRSWVSIDKMMINEWPKMEKYLSQCLPYCPAPYRYHISMPYYFVSTIYIVLYHILIL